MAVADGHRRYHVMFAAGKVPQHADGIFPVFRLAQDFAPAFRPSGTAGRGAGQDDHRVCRQEDLILLERAVKAVGLAFGHQPGHLVIGDIRTKVLLEVILRIYRKINAKPF